MASSHSDQVLRPLGGGPFDYSVAIEPLDGASVVDSNFAVGSVFGVCAADAAELTGRELIAAGACVQAARHLSLAHTGRSGVHEFLLMDDFWPPRPVGQTNTFEGMAEGRLFAPGTRERRARARARRDCPPRRASRRHRRAAPEPAHFPSAGNLRAAADNPLPSLVDHWLSERYQLRYTGGLCTDVNQLLVKGGGIFVSAAAAGRRPPPLPLYEALPLAFLMEKAAAPPPTARFRSSTSPCAPPTTAPRWR